LESPRSTLRVVHFPVDVKSWVASLPSCDTARPASCPACLAASREPGRRLVIVGHGLRARGVEGPYAPGERPAVTDIVVRRYRCKACTAVLVVVPHGVGRALRYALGAIACALGLWGYAGVPAARVRELTSAATARGFTSPEQWSSLRRWSGRARALFGIKLPSTTGTLRQRAGRVAAWLASQAPLPTGQVPGDAFFGAQLVHAR